PGVSRDVVAYCRSPVRPDYTVCSLTNRAPSCQRHVAAYELDIGPFSVRRNRPAGLYVMPYLIATLDDVPRSDVILGRPCTQGGLRTAAHPLVATGSRTIARRPRPARFSSTMAPPCAATMECAIDSPRPAPPVSALRLSSPRTK